MMRVAGLMALGMLGACARTTRNERPWMGQKEAGEQYGVVYLDSIRPDIRPETAVIDDRPSLWSLTRENWEPMVFAVPPDGVASRRTYAHERFLTRETARQRGDYPTQLTATELGGDTRGVQAIEGVMNPFIALVDMIVLPARMIAESPYREVYAYPESYWRAAATTLRSPVADVYMGPPAPAPPPPATLAPETGSEGNALPPRERPESLPPR